MDKELQEKARLFLEEHIKNYTSWQLQRLTALLEEVRALPAKNTLDDLERRLETLEVEMRFEATRSTWGE